MFSVKKPTRSSDEVESNKRVVAGLLIASCAVSIVVFFLAHNEVAAGERRSEVAKEHNAAVCQKLTERGHEHLPPFCSEPDEGDDSGEGGEEEETPATVGYVVISEVLYDLKSDGSQGSEIGGDNEWVEIYNGSDGPVDLIGWSIGTDVASGDVISDVSLVLAPDSFLVITDSTTTADYWDFGGSPVVYLDSSISGGLRNGGDAVVLFDESETSIDAVSWGDDVSAFDPAVMGGADGTSIVRSSLVVDTDTAVDWTVADMPTPGI